MLYLANEYLPTKCCTEWIPIEGVDHLVIKDLNNYYCVLCKNDIQKSIICNDTENTCIVCNFINTFTTYDEMKEEYGKYLKENIVTKEYLDILMKIMIMKYNESLTINYILIQSCKLSSHIKEILDFNSRFESNIQYTTYIIFSNYLLHNDVDEDTILNELHYAIKNKINKMKHKDKFNEAIELANKLLRNSEYKKNIVDMYISWDNVFKPQNNYTINNSNVDFYSQLIMYFCKDILIHSSVKTFIRENKSHIGLIINNNCTILCNHFTKHNVDEYIESDNDEDNITCPICSLFSTQPNEILANDYNDNINIDNDDLEKIKFCVTNKFTLILNIIGNICCNENYQIDNNKKIPLDSNAITYVKLLMHNTEYECDYKYIVNAYNSSLQVWLSNIKKNISTEHYNIFVKIINLLDLYLEEAEKITQEHYNGNKKMVNERLYSIITGN